MSEQAAQQLNWVDPEDANRRFRAEVAGQRGGGYAEVYRMPPKPKKGEGGDEDGSAETPPDDSTLSVEPDLLEQLDEPETT